MSLVELLIALAVVTIALFAIVAGQIGAFTASAQAREIADARDVATRGIADLRAAVVSDAATNPDRWDDLRNCDSPTGAALTSPSTPGAPPASSSCSGHYVETAGDGTPYSFRWVLGPPGPSTLTSATVPGGGTVTRQSNHAGMLRALILLEWTRRGQPRTLSFEDFISCVDVDTDYCPIGDGE